MKNKLFILFSLLLLYLYVYNNNALNEVRSPQKTDKVTTSQQKNVPSFEKKQHKQKVRLKLIGRGKTYEAPYYVYEGYEKGPTILLEAGIHGDEMAGTYALDKLMYKLKVKKGKVVIIPRMNILACQLNKRFINIDLNRVFAKNDTKNYYEYLLADEIYELVGKEKIEYVLTLHESKYLHDQESKKNYGQTVVYGVDPPPDYLKEWLKLINSNIEDSNQLFYPYYSPVEGSSTETLVEDYNLQGGFLHRNLERLANAAKDNIAKKNN